MFFNHHNYLLFIFYQYLVAVFVINWGINFIFITYAFPLEIVKITSKATPNEFSDYDSLIHYGLKLNDDLRFGDPLHYYDGSYQKQLFNNDLNHLHYLNDRQVYHGLLIEHLNPIDHAGSLRVSRFHQPLDLHELIILQTLDI